jgi:hypothetical protein
MTELFGATHKWVTDWPGLLTLTAQHHINAGIGTSDLLGDVAKTHLLGA